MGRMLIAGVLLWVALGARAAPLPSIELEVDLDPHTRALEATAVLQPPHADFVFVLHQALAVTAAGADGKPLRLVAAGRDGVLRAWRIAGTTTAPVRLHYRGVLPALDRRLDHRGVLQGLGPMVSAEGSFLPAGGGWYPRPAALFSYRVALSVPAGQRALVAGTLVAETLPQHEGERYRAAFEFAQAADGIDLMAGPWQVREQMVPRPGAAALRLRTWFPAELDAIDGLAQAYLDDSRRYIERYAAAIGPYPFDAFSVVASPLPTGFGMPTLTYIGAEVLKLPFIRATSLGHEVLHNWWGNGVFVDYTRGNWAEGLTTFMADHAYKEDESPAAAREMRLGWLRDFAAVPAGDHRPLASFRSRTHGAAAAVGYGQSAMLFVMLEDLIGKAAFDEGIRIFWNRHRFAVADWDALRSAFETASGRPLDAYFAQWLERPGGPRVSLSAARATPSATGARVTLDLAQSAPPYALDVPVEFVFDSGRETRRIALPGTQRRVVLDLAETPGSVRLDPELRLWRTLSADELPPILRLWTIARAPRLVVAGMDQASADAPLPAAAHALAARLFERPARTIRANEIDERSDPVLIVGLHAEVDATLAAAGLPARGATPERRGSAQVWTVIRPGGAPVAVISARDVDSLLALQRPLPHYGGQSWLVFEGSRALARGVWPGTAQALPVTRE